MPEEEEELVVARPSRWPVRVAYALALVTLTGAVWAWGEVREVGAARDAVLTAVDRMQLQGSDDATLRGMMRRYRELGSEGAGWRRTRLGLFLTTAILAFGGFIGTGLLNLHDKMEWQFRESRSNSGDDYGGH